MGFLDLKEPNSLEKMWMVELFHDRKFSVKAISIFSVFRLLDGIRLRVAVFYTLDSAICALTQSHFGFEEFIEFGLRDCGRFNELAEYFLGLSEQVV
jgi:hypothetical protein